MGRVWRLVVIESPFAGDIEANLAYLRRAMRQCLLQNEAPYASHALYTQEGVLDDTDSDERKLGIGAGFIWGCKADLRVVYIDRGVSRGMVEGIKEAVRLRQPLVFRSLEGRTGSVNVEWEGGSTEVTIGEEWIAPDPIESLHDLLGLVSHVVPHATLRQWTRPQRDQASEWAAAVHLDASDNDVEVPPKPPHLRGYEQAGMFNPEPLDDPSETPGMKELGGSIDVAHSATGRFDKPDLELENGDVFINHDAFPPTDRFNGSDDDYVPAPEALMHLWAMGSANIETACGVRVNRDEDDDEPTINGTLKASDVTCPGCKSRG